MTGDATVEETLDTFDKRAEQAPSPIDTDLYRSLVREGRRQWPGVEVTPALFEAGTDATPWRQRGIPVYGVYPYPISHADLMAMHGNDERIPITGPRAGHGHAHAGAAGRRRVAQGAVAGERAAA